MPTTTWSANEVGVLAQVRAQFGGSMPSALAGVEAANEPTIDATTVPMLTGPSQESVAHTSRRCPVAVRQPRASEEPNVSAGTSHARASPRCIMVS